MSTCCSHHAISNSAILAKRRSYMILYRDMRTEWQESVAYNVIVKGKIYLCVRNHMHVLITSIRKEIQHIWNIWGDTVTCVGRAFRRKNLLSPRQMSPNRTSVQPFRMATSHTATDSFKREKCAGSESTGSDDIGKFVACRLPSLCSFEQRLGDHRFEDNGEVKVR